MSITSNEFETDNAMEIQARHRDLFATRVWEYDLSPLQENFDHWRARVENLRIEQPIAAGRSNREGWNSDKLIFDLPEFMALLKVVRHTFAAAFEQMGSRGRKFGLEAWANVHDAKAFNLGHVHPGALLSGCFYLSMPEGAGNIVFHDPRSGAMNSIFQGKGVNNGQNVSVKPNVGSLLLFPAWLEHHVDPHSGTEPRVSIAMNAIPQ